MVPDPRRRLNIKQILDHPWLKVTTPPFACVSTAFVAKTLPFAYVSTAFVAKTLPFACVSTAFVAKTLPFACVSTAFVAPSACAHCFRENNLTSLQLIVVYFRRSFAIAFALACTVGFASPSTVAQPPARANQARRSLMMMVMMVMMFGVYVTHIGY